MADLLRSGHTMLNLSCPICNNPLFRNKNNEIFCSICNKKVIIKKEESNEKNSTKIDQQRNTKDILKKGALPLKYDVNNLKKILEEKLSLISQKLEKETQIDYIERYIKIMTDIFNLLNNLP
ncbi:MAG: Sjogren's syndrome/scleroderma autoantigen 1 family protein [Candidatus Hermodarchaeota archaeon]